MTDQIESLIDSTEFMFVGMARSGNHAIIHWVMSHLSADVAFMNNVDFSGNALQCVSGYGNIPHHTNPEEARAIAYSYEDKQVKDCVNHYLGLRERLKVLLILRDPHNLFASRLKQESSGLMPKQKDERAKLIWLSNALDFHHRFDNPSV